MKRHFALAAAGLLVAGSAWAQSLTPLDPKHGVVVAENDQLRAAIVTTPPGATIPRMQHPHFFVYVLQGGKLSVDYEDQDDELIELETGFAGMFPPEGWHSTSNSGKTTAKWLIVEFKQPFASGPALDGKSFRGEITDLGSGKSEPDDLVFADGKFDSVACHDYGFFATPYTTTTDGSGHHFSAQSVNSKGERMDWQGTVVGDTLSGTMTYHGKGLLGGVKDPQAYSFSATRPE